MTGIGSILLAVFGSIYYTVNMGLYFILIVIFIVSKKIIFPFAYFFLVGNNEIL